MARRGVRFLWSGANSNAEAISIFLPYLIICCIGLVISAPLEIYLTVAIIFLITTTFACVSNFDLFNVETIRVAISNAVSRVAPSFIRGLEPLQSSESDEVGCVEEERETRGHEILPSSEDDEPLQFNFNLPQERWDVLNDGTREHLNRQIPSAKIGIAIFSQTMTSIFLLKERGNEINTVVICLYFILFLNFVVMVLIEGTQRVSNHRDLLICIYGSAFALMLCGLFLLLLSSASYGLLAILPVVALTFMIKLFRQGSEFEHTQSATNYREHNEKLKYYYDFSLDVTNATFSGLQTYIFASPTIPHQNGEVKPTEVFLYITIVASLLLMLLSSVPPAVSHKTMTARVMKYMKILFYITMVLLVFVVLLVVIAVLGGGIAIPIYITCVTIYVVVTIKKKLQLCATNEPVEVVELDSPAMVVVILTFNILVAVYSKYVDDRTKVDDKFFLVLDCMLCCTAFITSLSKEFLMSDGTLQRWPQAKMIFIYISYAFAFAGAVSSSLL